MAASTIQLNTNPNPIELQEPKPPKVVLNPMEDYLRRRPLMRAAKRTYQQELIEEAAKTDQPGAMLKTFPASKAIARTADLELKAQSARDHQKSLRTKQLDLGEKLRRKWML